MDEYPKFLVLGPDGSLTKFDSARELGEWMWGKTLSQWKIYKLFEAPSPDVAILRTLLEPSTEERVYGRIIHSEISPEFGTTCGKVECPKCQEEIGIGVMDDPPPKCRCGFFWTLETKAVGTKQ
jgi:hypothetical protein